MKDRMVVAQEKSRVHSARQRMLDGSKNSLACFFHFQIFYCFVYVKNFSARKLARLVAVSLVVVPALTLAQMPTTGPTSPAPQVAAPTTSVTTPSAPAASVQPIQVADIAIQAEAALAQVRQFEDDGRTEIVRQSASDQLRRLGQAATMRGAETRRLVARNASLDAIRSMEEQWRDIELRASQTTRDLTRAATQLDRHLARFDQLTNAWNATRIAAAAAAAPPEVMERVRDVIAEVGKARRALLARRADVLALQGKSAELETRAAEARRSLADANEQATARLLYRDSLPLWSAELNSSAANEAAQYDDATFAGQVETVRQYAGLHRQNILLHAALFIGLTVLLIAVRRRVKKLCETDADLRRAWKVFKMPLVSAMLIALLFSLWLYPRAPRNFWILINVLGALPTLLFARRVIEPHLYPVLYGLVGFYLVDKLRVLLTVSPAVARLVFLAESVLALLFILWMLRVSRRHPSAPNWCLAPAWRVIRIGSWVALALVGIATTANVIGYVRLAELIGTTALASAYIALVLYTLTRVGEGLVLALLYVPPLSRSRLVQGHRSMLAHRTNRWLKRIAAIAWVALTLNMLGMLSAGLGLVEMAWQANATVGSLTLSVGDVIAFLFTIWAAVVVSRGARFVLDEEVFPKLRLNRGLPYAISAVVRYLILVTGIVLAVGAIGVDMTKFTILAGAFSVGIGFGLQNVVNNFVSGLIVLFERPVKVGDTIQIDDITGRVERIGIRASIVHATTGAEVIIPNGKLIADKLINWTLSDRLRQITVPVVTKPDADPAHIKHTATNIAREHEKVLDHPAPEALFIRRAIDAFEFELRVWTDAPDRWLQIRSELMSSIDHSLRAKDLVAGADVVPPPRPTRKRRGRAGKRI